MDCRKKSSEGFLLEEKGVATSGNAVVGLDPARRALARVGALELGVEALPELVLCDA